MRDRRAFFAYASSVMRSVLIDHVRERAADKRGGGEAPLTLTHRRAARCRRRRRLHAPHDALLALQEVDARCFHVVEMRYFAGMAEEDNRAGARRLGAYREARLAQGARVPVRAVAVVFTEQDLRTVKSIVRNPPQTRLGPGSPQKSPMPSDSITLVVSHFKHGSALTLRTKARHFAFPMGAQLAPDSLQYLLICRRRCRRTDSAWSQWTPPCPENEMRKAQHTLTTPQTPSSDGPSASATCPVVFEPLKMSTTRSLGSVSIRIKNSGSFAGKRAGWPLPPTALHPARYCPLDSELGI